MRKVKRIISIIIVVLIPVFAFSGAEPPDPGGNPGTNPPLGGGAPIGSGLYVMLFSGFAYGIVKVYGKNREELEE